MKERKLLGLGVFGAVAAALSCFTPLLVVLLSAVGLSAVTGWLDYVLVPLMIGSVALIVYAVRRSRVEAGTREPGDTGAGLMECSDRTERSRGIAVAAAGGGIGAAAAAALASACCVGPIAVSVLGVGGAMAAAGLAPYRPLLLGASLLLLGVGFWLVYRPPRVAASACAPGSGRWSKHVLWMAAGIILASFTVPYWVE